MDTQERRFITIKEFWQRLGKSKTWYTRHKRDPGFPQPADLGRPMLPVDEVEAYIDMKLAERHAKQQPPARKDPPPLVKRRVGRPVKPVASG
ncbi:hypothetical protein NKG99_20630 [Mesorhizobium sp. M1409]|uniref:helix-turn-helix transcriptional regulator n=1 Tax=Mesorhizobium sp. M1409 TaxID=2957100 RepID=UPI003338BD40